MKQLFLITISIVFVILTIGCSGHKNFHGTEMPDPHAFNAHFGDMDADGDDLVNWGEFSDHFPNSEQRVFDAIDLDQSTTIDHAEWHEFKAAHGLKHHD